MGTASRAQALPSPLTAPCSKSRIERNFYPGRTFADLNDLNAQAVAWCATYNSSFHKSYGGVPDELWHLERPFVAPLPAWVPEPTDVHPRRVDVEGYVRLHSNHYSVAERHIGHAVEVHETLEWVRVFHGHTRLAEHPRVADGTNRRSLLPEHRKTRRERAQPKPPSPEEQALRTAGPALAVLCDALRLSPSSGRRAVVRLHRMWLEYPNGTVESAFSRALAFGQSDLAAIERMVLKSLRGDFFRLPNPNKDDPDGR